MLTIRNFVLLQVKAEKKSFWLVLCWIIFAFLINTSRASAQITADTTLPSNSIPVSNFSGDLITITGGTNAGNNLFHSFQEFSVIDGQTAFFDNGITIENIFSRVTGDSLSNIDGMIRANGTASLFLINPNGVIFGPNSSLNIGGSFIGSTADSIQFSDGSFYSAIAPQSSSLLTINIPIGLQYGAQPGNIIVQGNGNNTGFKDPSISDQTLIKDFRPAGLQVQTGNSLALIGGNIALDGGNLTAAEGHIELGSVQSGLVKFNGNKGLSTFDYQEVTGFGDIALVNAASVEVSGNSSGTVNVQGQNISLADASAILSNTSGDGTAGSITLNSTESVQVTGVSQNEIPFVSYVSTGTAPGSTGEGADLTINTRYLLVAGGAQVDSPVFGSGDGGTLNVNAERVELIAGSRVAGSSGLFAPIVPDATGNGGDINLVADSLLVAGGAQAFALTTSSGTAGDFNITAQNIELNGTSPVGLPSGLFNSNFFGNGDGGDLTIETDNLSLIDGADIGSTVGGEGSAGDIYIKANTIELIDNVNLVDPSSISASVESGASGIGGNITIETNSLSLNNGTQINSSIFGSGDGGNITITASDISLNGYSTVADRSTGFFATVVPEATGNSGDITITTDNLIVSDGAQISVSTVGSGSAGNLKLIASDSIELTGNAIATNGGSSGLFSNAVFGDGDGGNLDLTTNHLIIKDGATINVSNFFSRDANIPPGRGEAGNINIDAQTIELDGVDAGIPARINAATFVGGGGDIMIAVEEFNLNNQAQVSVNSTGSGEAGDITIIAASFNLDEGNITATSTQAGGGGDIVLNSSLMTATNGAQITAETLGEGNGGSIAIAAEEFHLNNQAQVSVNSTGLGQAGDIVISAASFTLDEGKITATSTQTGGGDIDLFTDSATLNNNSLISTSVLDSTGGGGNILIENSGFIIGRNNSDIKADAISGPGGNIQINTQGIFFDPDSEITASSEFGTDGIVNINLTESDRKLSTVSLPDRLSTAEAVIVSSCPIPDSDTFTVYGEGGLPENPSSYLRGRTVWQDTRQFAVNGTNAEDIQPELTNSIKPDIRQEDKQMNPLVESQSWIINQRGKVELVAAHSQGISPTIGTQEINCGDL
ncbi:MAG: filamentous hemagglutinin N-terminal domain-containing protein [Cyanobacteria bacterium P01_F01_bin.143]